MAVSKKILLPFAALGLLATAAGCGSSTPATGTDAGTTPTDTGTPATDTPVVQGDAGPGQTYDYVINTLILDNGDDPPSNRGFYGFNLDGRFSPSRTASQAPADCSHGDYFSVVDPDQNMGTCTAGMTGGGTGCTGGVDNQLPNVAQTIQQFMASLNVSQLINDQITSGKLLIGVRVTGVNGALGATLNDPSVTVYVYPFTWAGFANCANIQMPGQMYSVDNRSLNTPGDLNSAKLSFQGSIVNGRLRVNPPANGATTPNFSLPLPVQGMTIPLNLFQTQLRVTMGATDGTLGNLGGFLMQGDLVTALTTIPALASFREAAAPLIQGFVDVATPVGGATASCDSPQGGIGVGLGFTTKSAVFATTTVSAAPTGVCGATTADGGVATDAGSSTGTDAATHD